MAIRFAALLLCACTGASAARPPVLHYEAMGAATAPPLVLLHGFGWSHKQWGPVADELAKHYRVINVDLPGHGRSPDWRTLAKWSYEDAAGRLLATLDAAGIRKFRAIGLSSGAITLLVAAARHPDRIEGLVLIGADFRIVPATQAFLRENACQPDPPEVYEAMKVYQPDGVPQIKALSALFCSLATEPMTTLSDAALARIKAPVLVVHGDRDALYPVEEAVLLYRKLPHAQLWVGPNGAHKFALKDPAFSPTVERFFSEKPAAGTQ